MTNHNADLTVRTVDGADPWTHAVLCTSDIYHILLQSSIALDVTIADVMALATRVFCRAATGAGAEAPVSEALRSVPTGTVEAMSALKRAARRRVLAWKPATAHPEQIEAIRHRQRRQAMPLAAVGAADYVMIGDPATPLDTTPDQKAQYAIGYLYASARIARDGHEIPQQLAHHNLEVIRLIARNQLPDLYCPSYIPWYDIADTQVLIREPAAKHGEPKSTD